MIAQLVGAGALIKLLLGIEYTTSVLIVGTLMTVYVIFGGMTARAGYKLLRLYYLWLAHLLFLLSFSQNLILV